MKKITSFLAVLALVSAFLPSEILAANYSDNDSSAVVTATVLSPDPTITSIAPVTVEQGQKMGTLVINGTNLPVLGVGLDDIYDIYLDDNDSYTSFLVPALGTSTFSSTQIILNYNAVSYPNSSAMPAGNWRIAIMTNRGGVTRSPLSQLFEVTSPATSAPQLVTSNPTITTIYTQRGGTKTFSVGVKDTDSATIYYDFKDNGATKTTTANATVNGSWDKSMNPNAPSSITPATLHDTDYFNAIYTFGATPDGVWTTQKWILQLDDINPVSQIDSTQINLKFYSLVW